jgi:hypothetical protein
MVTQAALREDFNKMLTKAKVATAAVALFAVIGGIAVARAGANDDAHRLGRPPGHMAPVIEALGKREPTMLRRLGESDALQPLRFNGE